MQRYIVQKTVYGKWAVDVLDTDGTVLQTMSIHETRADAQKWANILGEAVSDEGSLAVGTKSLAPPLLRGDLR